MNAPKNTRIIPDVSNSNDRTLKLLGYVTEELAKGRSATGDDARLDHLERAQVFMSEALRSFRSGT